MLKDREKSYQAYHAILSMALGCALTIAINQYFSLKVYMALCIAFSIFLALFVYLFDCNRKGTITYLIVCSLFPISAILFWIKKVNPLMWFQEIVHWCKIYNGSEELYVGSHAHIVLVGVALLSVIIFCFLMKNQIAKIILAVIIFVMLIGLSVSKVEINKVVVGISVFYILTILVEVSGVRHNKKTSKTENKAGILYLAPICLLLAIISVSIPSKPEPIRWEGIKNMYHNIKNQLDIWATEWDYFIGKSDDEFSLSLTGYSEDENKLGTGGVSEDDKIALRVSGFYGNNPIYLVGSVSNRYTGNSWEKSGFDFVPGEVEYKLDFYELIYALSRQELTVLEEDRFVERKTLKIEYNNIKTKTFFYPSKSTFFEMYGWKNELQKESANIKYSPALGKGTTYESRYYALNLQGEAFQKMLRASDTFFYENRNYFNMDTLQWLNDNLFQKDKFYSVFMNETNFYQLLANRASIIQKQYTNLPDSLPDRVKDLALEITKDYDNSYDKLKAIEEFLREYPYDLRPGRVLKGADFVDYFLFEGKEGYCTYYATAMAILARCIGIPTRYVEGFVVTYDKNHHTGMQPIRNSQAHSWAEAYFEGVGWIPFEATPPFYDSRYIAWKERAKVKEGVSSEYENQYDQEWMNEWMEQTQNVDPFVQEEKNSKTAEVMTGIIILFAAIIILILSLFIYYRVLRYKYKKAFDKADYSKKMYMLFLRIMNYMKKEGFLLEQQDTILMLARKVKNIYCYDKVTFSDIAEIFMRYRYAEIEVTKDEFEQVAIFHQGLESKQKEELPGVRRAWEEFVFLSKRNSH